MIEIDINRIQELERLLGEAEARAASAEFHLNELKNRYQTPCFVQGFMEIGRDLMLVLDAGGRIVYVNHSVEEATGYSCESLRGRDFRGCFSDVDEATYLFKRTMNEEEIRNFHITILHKNGGVSEVVSNTILYRNEDGNVEGVFLSAHYVYEIKEHESQMRFMAHYDLLTGLPNRQLFCNRLDKVLAQARRTNRVIGVLFVDIDNFKDINDALGQVVGDEVLKIIAIRINDALREGDTVARFGVDEFAILVEDLAEMCDIDTVAIKVLDCVSSPLRVNEHELVVSCSIGIALYPVDNSSTEGLLRNADTALHRAKEDGKNIYRHFTAEIDSIIRRRVDIGNRLRGSINANLEEFVLHYQPRIELASNEITGVEALLRWNAAGTDPISPDEFIPVAEKSGIIVQIGDWVLQSACRQAKQWQKELGMNIPVAVNLSARQFRDIDIAQSIERVLEQTGLSPDMLELELTESMLMSDSNRMLHTLDILKDIGVRLAVDDFGTGYSSLSYLKSFPLDYLKVDRSFVSDIPNDQDDMAIVQAIIGIAHNLGLKVIAEGVETRDQLDFMLTQDCDEVQGYFFSKPLSAEGMTNFLKNRINLIL